MKKVIYIAASWKHRLAVELLTERLEQLPIEVKSFVRNARTAEGAAALGGDTTQWIASDDGRRKFEYDVHAATTADAVIYLGPSGCDAWAEVGAAYASGVPVLGVWAKGEQSGLMRRMVTHWYTSLHDLIQHVVWMWSEH
ncbi:hypothetical protein [Desulfovibrio psychrotolerans]|uniref:Nucleoside 2-deoxyribosyltransferase n=1 Tax=Desulfovibrio psychrotolerans TaxID=415242 RepID=A0A7J0BWA5_9BACT|nr:hypothetical protein [Desulfovibrio psychrotolerans]GFM37978.1 hypothetical protein DSM19430T_26620 [Desulfovibrio psychrotolerans]